MTPKEAIDWCEQFTDNLVMVNIDTKKKNAWFTSNASLQICP